MNELGPAPELRDLDTLCSLCRSSATLNLCAFDLVHRHETGKKTVQTLTLYSVQFG